MAHEHVVSQACFVPKIRSLCNAKPVKCLKSKRRSWKGTAGTLYNEQISRVYTTVFLGNRGYEEMGKIGSFQNYSGLAGTSGTSGAGGVSGNKGQNSTKIQQGQSWSNRMSSWLQDSVQPHSPSQQSTHTPGTTEAKSGWSWGGIQNMVTGKKTFPNMNIAKWSNGGASGYDAQSVESLKEKNIFIESDLDGGMVMVDTIKLTPDSELPPKELNSQQMYDLADAMVEDTPAQQKTAAKSNVHTAAPSGKSKTPVLDEVASKWLADGKDWKESQVYEAAEEVMNKAGFGTTAKFRSKSDPNVAQSNRSKASRGVFTKFCEDGLTKNRSKMTTADFKTYFKLAVLGYASGRSDWFVRIDQKLTDAGWDPAN